MKLRIADATKSYGANLALDSFTATLEPGIYALLGPNGSGKSTLMNIITDNLKADSGELTIDKLPDTDGDTWVSVDFLQKPQLFQVGANYAKNMGIVNLIRWKSGGIQNFGPTEWKGAGDDSNIASLNFKEGDTLIVNVNKKDGKYVLSFNGVESNAKYDLTGIALASLCVASLAGVVVAVKKSKRA